MSALPYNAEKAWSDRAGTRNPEFQIHTARSLSSQEHLPEKHQGLLSIHQIETRFRHLQTVKKGLLSSFSMHQGRYFLLCQTATS